ncbi:MAG: hypothetical protein Q8O13_10450 [Candidatus Omnitrophota bacterium]|nr:hypothetical protein [Candidatus Omnitrophota bacterium]
MPTFSKDFILLFIIFPIYFIFLFFGIFKLIFFLNKKQKVALKKLADCLSWTIPKFSFYPSITGLFDGLRFNILLIPGGKNSPPYLRILLNKNSMFKLRVLKESVLSGLGKKIGLVREVKIYDEGFDKEFLIFSDKPDRAMSYFSNSEIKNAVRDLFLNGFADFIIDKKKILIVKPNYNLDFDLEPQRVIGILGKLSLLAKGI